MLWFLGCVSAVVHICHGACHIHQGHDKGCVPQVNQVHADLSVSSDLSGASQQAAACCQSLTLQQALMTGRLPWASDTCVDVTKCFTLQPQYSYL